MDAHWFDAWTRSLAHRLPRRSALAVLAGLGLLRAGARPASATMAQDQTCDEETDPTCPSGYYCDVDICERCLLVGDECSKDSDCCSALSALRCDESRHCAYCEWTGSWSTSWDGDTSGATEVRLTQSGSTVTGDYDSGQGQLTGTETGRVLKGTWSRQAPTDTGSFAFTMAEGCASFTGTWGTASEEFSGNWNGTRE